MKTRNITLALAALLPLFASHSFAQSRDDHLQEQVERYQSQVLFSHDYSDYSPSETEHASKNGVVQITYVYDKRANKVSKTFFIVRGAPRLFPTGQDASAYFSDWKRAIEIKTLFDIAEEIKNIKYKYTFNAIRPSLGSDYLTELATQLERLLKIAADDPTNLYSHFQSALSGGELISDDGKNAVSVNRLKSNLISEIEAIVHSAQTQKNRTVYNAFWSRVSTSEIIPVFFGEPPKTSRGLLPLNQNKISAWWKGLYPDQFLSSAPMPLTCSALFH